MKKLTLLLLVVLISIGVAAAAPPVHAQPPDPPDSEAGDGDETGASEGDKEEETWWSSATTTFFEMIFPIESMTAALRQSLERILAGTFEGLGGLYADAMYAVAFGEYASGPSTGVVQPFWVRVMGVSAVLWPLTLGLNVLVAARGGITANAAGYADLKESILQWVASCVGAAASLYVLRWGVELSNAIAHLLMPGDGRMIAEAIGYALADTAVVTWILSFVPGGLIFMLIFTLSLGFAMMTAFLFSFIARYVILFVLMTIAPLTLTLGAIPATRWLSWLWIKGIVLALLLRPANALLLHLAFGAASSGAFVVRMFVVTGILSLLLVINYAVASAVFSAVGEIAKKAKATTEQIVAGIILAAGTAGLGVAALGGVGAAGAGAAAGGSAGGAAGAGGSGAGGAAAASPASGAGSGGAGGGATGSASSAVAGGSGAGSGSGGVGARVKAALSNPQTRQRLGRVASGAGRGLQFTSRGPIGRALGSVAGGAGDLMATNAQQQQQDQQQQARAQRDRYAGQHKALAGWGMDPQGEGFYDVADAQSRLEAEYGKERTQEFAAPTARMMGAAQARGLSLNNLAQQAGFSSPGAWFGNRVEEGIMGRYGGGAGASLYPTGSGLQTPADWAPGTLTAYDLSRGLELAQMLGRTSHEGQIAAYADMVHAFRGTSGTRGVNTLLNEARSIAGQNVGRSGWNTWAPFAAGARTLASRSGVDLPTSAKQELTQLETFQPLDDI